MRRQQSEAGPLLRRAEAAARQGRPDEARHLLKTVLRRDPTNDQALLSLVYLAEDGKASLTYLARLLDAHPRHPQARTAIRWARRRMPTTPPVRPESALPRQPVGGRNRRIPFLGLTLLLVCIGLGLAWQGSQSAATPTERSLDIDAQSVVSHENVLETTPSATARPLFEIEKVLIPLFTPTPSPPPTPTPSRALVPVVGRPQSQNLSCESRSAADLAGHWGIAIDELAFLASLGQSDNPHKGFVGDVSQPPGSLPPFGYGVYAEPVATSLRAYGLDAQAVYDLGLDGLKAELLVGRPVLVWATYGMRLYETIEWTSDDGRVSTVVPFMHTFLITGFDESGFFALDAYDATVQHYPTTAFLDIWNIFDQMAVVVTGPLSPGGDD